jgi:hypothetical protein
VIVRWRGFSLRVPAGWAVEDVGPGACAFRRRAAGPILLIADPQPVTDTLAAQLDGWIMTNLGRGRRSDEVPTGLTLGPRGGLMLATTAMVGADRQARWLVLFDGRLRLPVLAAGPADTWAEIEPALGALLASVPAGPFDFWAD